MSELLNQPRRRSYRSPGYWLRNSHLDGWLMIGLLALLTVSMVVLYSSGGEDISLSIRQAVRMSIAFVVMFIAAQIHPDRLRDMAYWAYGFGLLLLIAVLFFGDIGKGAQRWLDLGFMRFQPSEIMKIAVPLLVAAYLSERPLAPSFMRIFTALVIIAIPVVLIAKQPDLGTAILIASAGLVVIFLAGISWKLIFSFVAILAAAAPLLWFNMHAYQQRRVLTFLNPENDPLGAGYHIIQSKIAIGSGGLSGRGWLQGTQSHLEFLPERSTDFIFAVIGE
ncbi:MAG: FtsW/RodA/SpoVE family cell cycle protein, partial [Methylophaga sp.]|nr:FtsW/RodA/SpoVE family cell cycle protein [Methylophaga sp.]